jgi:hypothetical protein
MADAASWNASVIEAGVATPDVVVANPPAAPVPAPTALTPLAAPTLPTTQGALIGIADSAAMSPAAGAAAASAPATEAGASPARADAPFEATEARPPEIVSAPVPTAPVVVPLPGRGRSMQPTLPFGIPVPVPNSEGADAAHGGRPGAVESGSFAALLDREAEKFQGVYTPEAPKEEAAAGVARAGVTAAGPSGAAMSVAAPPVASAMESGRTADSALRSTSDAPTVQNWVPPEFQPSRFKRFAPLGAALTAVVIAFVVGLEIGKSNPRPSSAAASGERPNVARALEPAKPAAPAPAPAAAAAPDPDTAESAAAPPPARAGVRGGSVRTFSAKTAGQVLGQAGYRARGCKKPGNPGGVVVATVTFAPSGRVDDVVISGARIAGTPMANCIAATLRSARLAPFSGQAQTVKKSLRFD